MERFPKVGINMEVKIRAKNKFRSRNLWIGLRRRIIFFYYMDIQETEKLKLIKHELKDREYCGGGKTSEKFTSFVL